MDVMELRRRMMVAMAIGGDKFFEVIERFTPSEDLVSYTFTHSGVGRYICCEEPILTLSDAISQNRPNQSLLSCETVVSENASHTLSANTSRSLTYNSSNGGYVDYWAGRGVLSGTDLTIGISSSNNTLVSFLSGHTYVVLKMKI